MAALGGGSSCVPAAAEGILPVISLPLKFRMSASEADGAEMRVVAQKSIEAYLSAVSEGTEYLVSAEFLSGSEQRAAFLGSVRSASEFANRVTNGAGRRLGVGRGLSRVGFGLGPWKEKIVSTVFWVGEPAGGHNPVANYASAWNQEWSSWFGGADLPRNRVGFLPARFVPHASPFYVALPYNDLIRGGPYRPEASRVIPWFHEAIAKRGFGVSTLQGHWVAIRNREKDICYAQWEDVGPFQTDHWQYVFGSERPRPNRNGGAGLDVSPAVRDYLGLRSLDVVDWSFVDEGKVPDGPWKWAYRPR